MKKGATKQSTALKILRLFFIAGCLAGFLYQTLSFLMLYWTYPTVVDIQQSEPSYLDMPAFTICNSIGYNLEELCKYNDSCLHSTFTNFNRGKYCHRYPDACLNGFFPNDFQVIKYTKFMRLYELTMEDHDKLRERLENFTTCTIEFAGQTEDCNLDNVMGPFFTREDLPQYCYSIYSLWGQPNKKRARIAKGAVMHFHFELNFTQRPDPVDPIADPPKPRYSPPGNPMVQMAIHSPFFLPSPYLDGMSFIGGRAYELTLTMNERHLLPAPYQTNCTDYMKTWKERNGTGPINQMGVVQECRLNKTFESLGCIPVDLDYPHTYKLCRGCFPDNCNYTTFAEECGKLADHFTQPCDALTYTAVREDKVISTIERIDSAMLGIHEVLRRKVIAYNCDGRDSWTKECSTIDVDVQFDRFEITNLTYNPKFESLELFSVIGGYMGMWLGISLLTVYDFIGSVIVMIRVYGSNRQKKTKIMKMEKEMFGNNYPPSMQSNYPDFMDKQNVYGRQQNLYGNQQKLYGKQQKLYGKQQKLRMF